MKSFQLATLLPTLLGTALASPMDLQARAPITSADFSNFAVTCNASTCSISSTITLQPEGYTITCSHSVPGPNLPSTSGTWTCSDSNVWPRWSRAPSSTAPYRIFLTDARDPKPGEPSRTVQYLSPRGDWPGDGGYSGPSSFTATA